MQLLSPITFASSVASARNILVKISKMVGKYIGESSTSEFVESCDKLDYNKVNKLLDKTVEKLSGQSSVSSALTLFAYKLKDFAPNLEKEMEKAKSESDKVKVIAAHKELRENLKKSLQ